MWGARVKVPCDMGDDMLKDAVETCRRILEEYPDFETDGLRAAEEIKHEFDNKWSPNWHVVVGRSFGSYVTHETKCFVYFYIGDKAVMMYKAG